MFSAHLKDFTVWQCEWYDDPDQLRKFSFTHNYTTALSLLLTAKIKVLACENKGPIVTFCDCCQQLSQILLHLYSQLIPFSFFHSLLHVDQIIMFVALCCNPLTLQPEQSSQQGSNPTSTFECHDKGLQTRLALSNFCHPSAWR